MTLKRKKCRKCDKLALPNRAVCYDHWRERQRKLREASQARTIARRAKKKEKMTNSLSYLKKKAWKLQSKAIRHGAADEFGEVTCYTCGNIVNWQDSQLGHYKHGRLDFDTARNLRVQCVYCNKFLHGNLSVFAANLVKEGIDIVKLELESNTKGNDYSISELKEIIQRFS